MPEINEQDSLVTVDDVINAFIEHLREHAGDGVANEMRNNIEDQNVSVKRDKFLYFLEGRIDFLDVDCLMFWANTPQGQRYWNEVQHKVPLFRYDPTC